MGTAPNEFPGGLGNVPEAWNFVEPPLIADVGSRRALNSEHGKNSAEFGMSAPKPDHGPIDGRPDGRIKSGL